MLSPMAGDEPFDRLARLAARILEVPTSLVTIVEEDRQRFPGQAGLPEPWATRRETPLSYSFCKHVVAAGAPVEIADAARTTGSATTPRSPSSGSSPISACRSRLPTARSSAASAPWISARGRGPPTIGRC